MPPFAATVRDCLKHLGYTVLEAASGEAALEMCESPRARRPSDDRSRHAGNERPGNGRTIRQRYPEIRLMYTSGYTEDGAARRELLQEGTIFLEKPYTVADLARAVQRALFAGRGESINAEALAARVSSRQLRPD